MSPQLHYLAPIFSLFAILLLGSQSNGWVSENRRIEEEILKNYDRRHRPVKKESTAVKVQLFLTVNHIERVDEQEGTMLLHGILWASWFDEYLRWTPSEHNNTLVISMDAWKIWQPTFALYNSARSNSWFVYMNGVPATVSNDGRIFAAGTFSFHVTCQFDFSDFPYDAQKCPIVLADWVYDLSKVNLSEVTNSRSGNVNPLGKPAIRLSFDPLSEGTKRHVAGWEIIDTWQRHCFWGPRGYCVDESPIGPLDNYWSLIEFGVNIKRHAPYFGITLLLPTFITLSLTLLIFWLENLTLAVFICTFNLILEAFAGWNLSQQMPPGDGVIPTIGVVHMWNLSLTLLAILIHCIFHFLLSILPPETEFLPKELTNFTNILRQYRFFQTKGISFDPQTIMGFEPLVNHVDGMMDAQEEEDQLISITNPSPIIPQDSLIIEMEPVPPAAAEQPTTSQSLFQTVKLEETSKSMSKSSSQQSMGQKRGGLFGGMFGTKEEKMGPTISTPFLGMFGANAFAAENGFNFDSESIEKSKDSENGNEMGDDDGQLLIAREGDGDNGANIGTDSGKGEEGGKAGEGGKKEKEEVQREPTALERELFALRRLFFGFFLFIEAILTAILVF